MRAFAIGDSIIRSGGVPVSDDLPSVSWAVLVAESCGWDIETFARTGARTREVLDLIPKGRYDVALVCSGTNDALSVHDWSPYRFLVEYGTLLDAVAKRAGRVIVLGLIPNVGALPAIAPYGWGRAKRVATANRIIEEQVLRIGGTYVPAPALARPAQLFGDHIHPNSAGNVALANAVLYVLGRAPLDGRPLAPSADYLRAARRRTVQEQAKRSVRGPVSSVLATVRAARRR